MNNPTDYDPHAGTTRTIGISLMLTAKGADLATTAAVVAAVPAAEANPVVTHALAAAGLPALLALSLVACIGAVVAAEAGARVLRYKGPLAPVLARAATYGPLTVLWTYVAVRNAEQIAAVLP